MIAAVQPRMLKILFAFSLALLAVTLGAWLKSYDAVFVRAYEGNLVLIYADENIHPRAAEQGDGPSQVVPYVESLLATGPDGWVKQDARMLGLRWLRIDRTRLLLVPFAYLALIPLALCVTAWLRLRRQVRRQRLGLCLRCGYDLRHSPGACPECGGERDGRRATEGAASESDRAGVRAGGGDAGGERVREPRDAVA